MKVNRPKTSFSEKLDNKQIGLKEQIVKMIHETPKHYDFETSSNEELIAQSLIENARRGNSQSIKILSEISQTNERETTPEVKVTIVDNTRLEKFMYMTDEELAQWEQEHKGMKEYKITCLTKEIKSKL